MNMRIAAIILAGGKGKRMQSDVAKQYLQLEGHPILYYTIRQFEESFVDEIILVAGENDLEYCKNQIVDKYDFKKVTTIVPGGKERYHSVYNGLQKLQGVDYVFIHDGVRPFITKELLEKEREEVEKYKACALGVPVKDTIKIVDEKNIVIDTPNRAYTWAVHTPQVFSYSLIMEAYKKAIEADDETITDDAMVVERFMNYPVRLIEGDYKNIKITTPEDLEIASMFLKQKNIPVKKLLIF